MKMKKQEYAVELKNALLKDITVLEKRVATERYNDNVCMLSHCIGFGQAYKCRVCPIWVEGEETPCNDAVVKYNRDPSLENAQAVLVLLKKINVNKWANRLAKQGYVK